MTALDEYGTQTDPCRLSEASLSGFGTTFGPATPDRDPDLGDLDRGCTYPVPGRDTPEAGVRVAAIAEQIYRSSLIPTARAAADRTYGPVQRSGMPGYPAPPETRIVLPDTGLSAVSVAPGEVAGQRIGAEVILKCRSQDRRWVINATGDDDAAVRVGVDHLAAKIGCTGGVE